ELGADAFRVFFEFGGVVGLGDEVFQKNGVRDADGLQVLHRRAQGAVIDVFVAPEAYPTHLNLRPFANHERDADGVGRNRAHLGANRRELTPVLREQLFQRHFGLLDLGRVVLVLHRQSHFAILEAVEHVAGGNRIQAGVVDLADGRPLLEVDVKNPAFGALFALKADVLKVARVPQGVEVAFDGGRVVDVADLGKDAGPDRVGRDAAVAVDGDPDDQILLGESRYRQKQKSQ